ncbi:hypothetical protein EG329_011078 [Mollisiaceae sp. DMI_Dod_QoI]|nr:hypothetical protein EG329_011078 [Helotiales sp. DMI_Dod_QoI]
MSQSVIRFDTPVLSNVWKADDDWTDLAEKQERKKRQNRLNQRAYRMRNAPKEPAPTKRRPFRVERFRITETISSYSKPTASGSPPPRGTITFDFPLATLEHPLPQDLASQGTSADTLLPQTFAPQVASALALNIDGPESSIPTLTSTHLLQHRRAAWSSPTVEGEQPDSALTILDGTLLQVKEEEPFRLFKSKPFASELTRDASPNLPIIGMFYAASEAVSLLDNAMLKETYFPLSSDHLLRLIHFNVYRALVSNKLLLLNTTSLIRADEGLVLPSHQNLCEGLSLVRTKQPEQKIPPNLYPTTKQMSIAHSSWLNMFPFPRVRDNLILSQKDFNHRDLCNDLFGELFFRNIQSSSCANTTIAANGGVSDFWDDDVAARRRGFIVWGEPWDVNSWEVTPGFLKEWPWVLEGCEEVIVASNRWRAQRDEPPLEYLIPFD